MPMLAEYRDDATAARTLAAIVAGQLAAAVAARGRATLAVPGGTTPGAFLTALSHGDLAWRKVSVLLTDERFVPPESKRSNTRHLRATLFANRAAAAALVPLYSPAETPEEVLKMLSGPIRAVLPIDVCVLGMGSDMHTASLFRGADRLAEALAPDCPDVLMAMRAPGVPEPRLTLTAPVLTGARNLHLLIRGPEKKAALARAERAASALCAPVRIVLARDDLTIHHAEVP